jgi:TP901 family phage tail tape measure protein
MAASFDIVAKLRADATQFVTGLKAGEVASTKFAASMGGVTQAVAVGTAAAVATAGVMLFKLGSSFHDAYKQIRVTTGATGETLKELEGSFKTVFAQSPASMKDVGAVIGDLNVKLGLTGKPLEDVSLQMLKLSRMTGTDLKTNIESVTGVFKNFNVAAGDQKGALDLLYRASQTSGVEVSTLTDQMSKSGLVLRQMGFDFESTAALMGTLAKSGIEVRDILPAMTKALATAGKQGIDAKTMFESTFNAIKDAKTPTEATGIALEVFGARGGPKLAAAIAEGKLSFEEYMATIVNGTDTISKASGDVSTFGGKLSIMSHRLQLAFEPLATAVFQGMNEAMKRMMPILTAATDFLGDMVQAFLALPDPVMLALPAIALFVVALKGLVAFGALISGLATAVIGAFGTMAAAAGTYAAQFLAAMGLSEAAALQAGIVIESALGPIAILLGVAFIAFTLWNKSQEEGKQHAKDFAGSLDEQTGAWTKNTEAVVANKLAADGTIDRLSDAGISMDAWRKAVEGGTEGMISASDSYRLLSDRSFGYMTLTGQAIDNYRSKLGQVTDAGYRYTQTELSQMEQKHAAQKAYYDELRNGGNAVNALMAQMSEQGVLTAEIADQLRTETTEYAKKQEMLKAVGISQNMATGLDKEAATAAYELERANKAAADGIKAKHDAQKAALDPMFANLDALKKMKEAQVEYDKIQADGTKSQAEKEAAYYNLVSATGAYSDSLNTLEVGLKNGTVTQEQVRGRLEELIRLGIDPGSEAFKRLAAQVDFAQGGMKDQQGVSLTAIAAFEEMKKKGLDPTSEAAKELQEKIKAAGYTAMLVNGTYVMMEMTLEDKNIRWKTEWLMSQRDEQGFISFGDILMLPRAFGGPVAANTPYLVGERGPELFMPSNSGKIISNSAMAGVTSTGGSAMSGGNVYEINVNVSATADSASVGRTIVEAISAFERRSGAGWRS